MWNFRRGVDWATDPTGNTALPLNCFIDSINGVDTGNTTGDNPTTPLKTLTQAKTNFGSTYTVIAAPGRYTNEDTFNRVVIGDSEDQDVIFVDELGVLSAINENNTENLVLIGYLSPVVFANRIIINCTFLDCPNVQLSRFYGCRVVNSAVNRISGSTCLLRSCAFLNSPFSSTISTTTLINGCYFDENSTFNLITGAANIEASHFENKITWDITGNTYATSNTDGDPFINDADLLNFSFDPLNSPLFGRGYPDGFSNPRHMARYYIGNGFYSGLTSFDDKVAANANLSVVANELLNVGTNDIEFIETDEITLSSLQAIGVPQKVGIISYLSTVFGLNPSVGNLDRVLEIRYADTDSGALSTYQQYRFGEQATNNGDGTGNGETGYNWADNNPIFVKKYQFRIGVVKAGVI